MADPNSDPPSFEGTSSKECEAFVATIRRRAFDQGKHRDNEWMAGLASTYFVGDALYWYEELDEDLQNDWSRLRPALLARFGRGGLTSTTLSGALSIPASVPSQNIPTPAAAPPAIVPRPLVRKGHLKLLKSDGSLHGFLAKPPGEDGWYTGLSEGAQDALLVSFPVSSAGEAFEIQIISASQHPQTNDVLAIHWPWIRGNNWMDQKTYVAHCCSFLTVTSNKDWAIERKVWKISKAGELSVEYPKPDGGTERVHCWLNSGIRFRRLVPAESERGRIAFEDVA